MLEGSAAGQRPAADCHFLRRIQGVQGPNRSVFDPAPVDMAQTPRLETLQEEEEDLKALGRHGRRDMFHYLFSTTTETGAPSYREKYYWVVYILMRTSCQLKLMRQAVTKKS
ncbi:hypothetical protein BPAE_0140g00260 [Botrytis paeoniae]|uniref:Uncharacterized protein n=1 Tax=Botrytis paeoniae TaxID=278948 RepID=A0A4Z1FJK9_9HELO|nr:hypothetical protein BPAE_0140g00260 [Botrytis paeoniae]